MLELVPKIKELWLNKQDSLINSADSIVQDIVNNNLNKTNDSDISLNKHSMLTSIRSLNFSNKKCGIQFLVTVFF